MLPRTESVKNISSQKTHRSTRDEGEEIRDVPGLKGLALFLANWLIGARLFDAGEICELKLYTATCLASHYVGKRHRTNNEPQNRIINV